MRYWLFAEPVGDTSEAIWMIYSDDAILAEYWETWKTQGMAWNTERELDPGTGINPIRCIEDWVTVHWAVPATPENLVNIVAAPKPQLI